MTSVQAGLVTRSHQRLAANPSRVITRLFVPGQEGFEHQESRAGAVLERILALDEGQVRSSLDDVVVTAFLNGPGATPLPIVIFSRARLGLDPSVNAVATLIIFVVAVVVAAASIWVARNERR